MKKILIQTCESKLKVFRYVILAYIHVCMGIVFTQNSVGVSNININICSLHYLTIQKHSTQ